MPLSRYREVVREWDRFVEATGTPEATTIRVRRRTCGPAGVCESGPTAGVVSVVDRLRAVGFELEPVDGVDSFYRILREPFAVSKTLEHWMGDFYIQQAVTGLAGPALGVRPGDRVLDLCAAPGGKTVHMADLLEGHGIVVASDADDRRIRALLANVYRLSQTSVLVVQADGRSFPAGASFDRVLVDAPCSAEGNVRQRGGRVRPRDSSFVAHIRGVQEALLRRALDLVRPGGVVLYATCTFAPEENEAVVDSVLRRGGCAVEPIDLDAPHEPGLTRFEGLRFRDELAGAWRIYPHHLDSGGLFLARLRRLSGEAPDESPMPDGDWRPVPERFPDAVPLSGRDGHPPVGSSGRSEEGEPASTRVVRAAGGVAESFGLHPEGVRRGPARNGSSSAGAGSDTEGLGLRWTVRGDSVWTHRCSGWPLEAWDPGGPWRAVSLGLRATKQDPRTAYGERPTGDFLRFMDHRIRDRVVDVERSVLLELLERRRVEGGESGGGGAPGLPERGFVALRFRGRVVGRGWIKDGILHNEIAKPRSRDLEGCLRASEPDLPNGTP